MNAYAIGVQAALQHAGLIKEADFDIDDLQPALGEVLGTFGDMAIPAGTGAATGAIYGALADEGDAGVSALRGLISGAGTGLGANIAHRLTYEPSFWGAGRGEYNAPAALGGAAGGGLLSYLLARQLVPEKE